MGRTTGLAALLLAFLGCGFDLRSGTYQFRQTELVRADCALDPPLPTAWTGDVSVRGSTVVIQIEDPAFRANATQQALVGIFRTHPEDGDRFLVASSSEIVASINGIDCLVFAQLEIAAEVVDDERFDGTFLISYSRQVAAAPECPFSCLHVLDFDATRR